MCCELGFKQISSKTQIRVIFLHLSLLLLLQQSIKIEISNTGGYYGLHNQYPKAANRTTGHHVVDDNT